jgi:hypothetical protein
MLKEIEWAKSTNDEMHTTASLNIIAQKIIEIKEVLNEDPSRHDIRGLVYKGK